LPTFAFTCHYNPVVVGMYASLLRKPGFAIPHNVQDGSYRRYIGDAAVPGKGELLVWQPHPG
jgi:hypothetical protein